jgi:hypothetical protein
VVVSFDRAGNRSVGLAILVTPRIPKLIFPTDGLTVTRPPVLRWVRVLGADYYNVQLFRVGRKMLAGEFRSGVKLFSAWPTSTHLALQKQWRYRGRTYLLIKGVYRWFVWSGYGSPSANRYGPLLGQSTFVVRR